ncbi:tetratricopeptide repeat protein [Acinetobacter sp. WCHAc010034]|uniref:tetratricopeptide repeat protein n=1 Tax=Acinetobacter sp. WCHAc010034 TaxID=1879049 RepID=UPI00083B4420|nr:tetratricopeptide repeat protein [Acinetobacter sp. WCHAc010034]
MAQLGGFVFQIFVQQSRLNCQLPLLSNDSIEEINNSAFYLYKLGYYNESLFFLKNVLKRDPDRVAAYLNIADVYQALNQKEEARKNYKIYYLKMKKLGLTKNT